MSKLCTMYSEDVFGLKNYRISNALKKQETNKYNFWSGGGEGEEAQNAVLTLNIHTFFFKYLSNHNQTNNTINTDLKFQMRLRFTCYNNQFTVGS